MKRRQSDKDLYSIKKEYLIAVAISSAAYAIIVIGALWLI